jgi:hypothetical protein
MPETQPFSPLWWLELLEPKLTEQAAEAQSFLDYYDGDQPIASIVTEQYRDAFARMIRDVVDNWMPIVVDAVEERLHVEGFRFGKDAQGDADAWAIWQRNYLDADSEIVHSVACTAGLAAVMVWPDADGEPVITVEHPTQVYVEHVPGARRKRAAALKVFVDDWTGDTLATLYLPESLHKFRRSGDEALWVPRGTSEDDAANPLGVVPIVPMLNRPTMFGKGRSEIAEVTSTQDQVNKLVADMLIASEFSAFKQRWATGIEVPIDPETGEEVEVFTAAVQRVWHTASETAKFGEFGETNLANYVGAIENRVQSLASRTRTPPHYLLGGSGSFPSGESLKATETGLIAKVRSRQRHYGETWEEVIRLAFAIKSDDKRAKAYDAETIWRDPESRTEAEHVDALGKLRTMLSVPLEQLWADAGYTPQQIARFRSMLAEEALNRAIIAQPAQIATGSAPEASTSSPPAAPAPTQESGNGGV